VFWPHLLYATIEELLFMFEEHCILRCFQGGINCWKRRFPFHIKGESMGLYIPLSLSANGSANKFREQRNNAMICFLYGKYRIKQKREISFYHMFLFIY
jgi:hypothetical protein